MTIYCGNEGLISDVEDEIVRLEKLVEDLKHLRRKGRPPSSLLERAPVILNAVVTTREAMCFKGTIVGHPDFATPREMLTSEVVVAAPRSGWVRSASRYYRLEPDELTVDSGAARWN